ncbi:MAG TPA: hypothetical protein VNI61_05110, partial [Gemmatimonadales bacterium]|nr:hypothetical protein [Gemmatimonadales bacterium]
ALGAGTLVEGSVEPVGQRVRVTFRLVDGSSGADFRRESIELPAAEALTIRDSVARQAAFALREWLGEEIRLAEQRAGTRSIEAWTLVQRAEKARKEAEAGLAAGRPAGALAALARADSLLAAAERFDPQWVEPVLARGRIAYRLARLSLREPAEAEGHIVTGLEHAERALRIAPNDAPALELRGTLRYTRWISLRPTDPAGADSLLAAARADLERAVELDPSLASAFSTLSHLYYQHQVGDVAAAVLAARRAYEEDAYLAVAPDILWRLFLGSYDLAQFAQARRWCDEGYRRFPGNFRFTECRLWLMTTPAEPPDVDFAWRLAAEFDSLVPPAQREIQSRRARIAVATVIGRSGRGDSADRVFARARPAPELDPRQSLLCLEAAMRAVLNQRERALDLVRRCVAANPEHQFRSGDDVHWWWRALRDDPGFRSVVETRP